MGIGRLYVSVDCCTLLQPSPKMPTPNLILTSLVVALVMFGSVLAADKPVAQADIDKLQEQVRTLDKELAVQREAFVRKLDDVEKRQSEITAQQANNLAVISNQTATVGYHISNTSILVTVLVLAAGFITYFSAKSRAEKEARDASKQWFEQNAVFLRTEIQLLQAQVKNAVAQIENEVAGIKTTASSATETMEKYASAILRTPRSSPGSQPAQQLDLAAIKAVNERSDLLKAKPESQFTAEEFFARGLAYFLSKDFSAALSAFQSAIQLGALNVAPDRLAQFLYGKAMTLNELGMPLEAIAVYDEIDKRFSVDATPAVLALVAEGIFNKGTILDKMDKPQDAIAVFDNLYQRFGVDRAPAVRELVASGLYNTGNILARLGEFEAAISMFSQLDQRFGTATEDGVLNRVARGLVGIGTMLGRLGQFEEEIGVYDSIDKRFALNASQGIREEVAAALANKGIAFGLLGKSEEAIAVCNDLDQRFGSDSAPRVREMVAKGLFNKGYRNVELGKHAEGIAIYSEVNQRYGNDTEPRVREQVIKVLSNWSYTLNLLSRFDEAVAITQEIDQRFGSDIEPRIRVQVVNALSDRGLRLGALGKVQEEISVYDEIDQRFGQDAAPEVRDLVCKVLNFKGYKLGQQGKYGEAVTVYQKIDERFREDTSPSSRVLVASALNAIAFNKIMLAKITWSENDQSSQHLATAATALQRALNECLPGERILVLGNLGYCLFLEGQHMAAVQPTLECLQMGGQNALTAQLKDATINRVEPEDTEYEALLNSLWQSLPVGTIGQDIKV